MWKYFLLQVKRVVKLLPYVGLAAVVLFGGLLLVLNGIVETFSDEDTNTRLPIAIVGTVEDSYFEMGIAALQSIDSSRYAIEVVEMDEDSAKSALEKGDLAAYVVIPDGFVDAALDGKVMTIDYVTTVGARGLVSMFKDEITHVISDIVLACQRGMYGIEGAYKNLGVGGYGKHVNKLSVSYVELVLIRSRTYEVEELGIRDELGLEGYLFSGICVVFFALSVLPFGQLLIKQDLSLNRILASRCYSVFWQTVLEFLAFFIGYALALIGAFSLVSFGLRVFDIELQWLFGNVKIRGLLHLIPSLLLVSSFAYMLYNLSTNLVGGMLMQFFVSVAMCFAGGCMYPVTFFPESIQNLAKYLPHGLARESVSGFLMNGLSTSKLVALLGYSVLFTAIAVGVRSLRMSRVRG